MLPERKRATLFLVLIFLCGAAAGAVGVNLWQKLSVSARSSPPAPAQSTAQSTAQPASPGTPSPRTLRAVESFTKRLNLTPEQKDQLTQILVETRNAYRQHEHEIALIRKHGNTRIREILTEQQKIEFDQMLEKSKRDRP